MDAIKAASEFLSDPFQRMLVLVLLILGAILLFYSPVDEGDLSQLERLQQGRNATLEVHFFYSPTCPHCKEQEKFNEVMVAEFPQIVIVPHNMEKQEEVALMQKMVSERGGSDFAGVPKTFIGNRSITGFDSAEGIGKQIRQAIKEELEGRGGGEGLLESEIELPFLGKVKPSSVSLPVLAIVLGLVDGFNPCAMWVLVYLIGVVLSLNDKRKLWLLVGSFVLASGVLYFLFMTAWLNAFLFIGYFRPVTVAIGLVALGGGILFLKEFMKNPRGVLECKVTGAEEKKKTMGEIQRLMASPVSWATIAGIVALAFAINSVEFVCSAALPAVFTSVLALSGVGTVEHYLYILLYVLFFMLDDLVIFGLAAMAVSSEWGQKYAGYCKVAGGIIMLALGIVLLFAPQYLR